MSNLQKFILLVALFQATFQLSCLNKNGQENDYFTLLKYPGSVQQSNFYGYYTSDMTSSQFKLGQASFDSNSELFNVQLTAINSVRSVQIIAWNDEAPNLNGGATHQTGAHSKGIIAYDPNTDSGVYIIHSIPKYPGVNNYNNFVIEVDSSQNIYGQSIMCLSMNGANLDKVAKGLLITNPTAYFSNFKTSSLSNLQKLGDNTKVSGGASLQISYTAGSTTVTGFFKNPSNQVNMFEDIMIPGLKTSLNTETWGRPYTNSACSINGPYNVQNIKTIAFNSQDTWTDTNDHSKYCVSPSSNVVCVGDMNHMISQQKRGGSFHCLTNSKLVSAFRSIISSVESCTSAKSFLSITA